MGSEVYIKDSTWIGHPVDNSFPDNHTTVVFSAAFALLSLRLRAPGPLMLLVVLPVTWLRIYLGVCFPLDMVDTALVSISGVVVAKRVWQAVGPWLVLLCETVNRRMFSWLPTRFTP